MQNIEQQEQTKTNYNTKYLKTGTNKNQLQCQKWNSSNKQKPTMIPNIEQQQQQKANYNTKCWTAVKIKIQLNYYNIKY